ncbi:carbohydrate-binding module family 50 protein [Penicillium herquei]|nr:carbohydrate-binding module family 50 protein [Penicillium herquei]
MPSLSAMLFPFFCILSFSLAASIPSDGPVQSPADGPVQRLADGPKPGSSHYVLQPQDDKCITVVAKFPDMGYGARGLANFHAWNPQVNSPSCNNLRIGQQYCVGAVDLDVVCPLRRGRVGDLGEWHFG